MTDADLVHARTAANRLLIADFFDSLDDQQLATQSLCGEWTVRDVLGHLVLPLVAGPRLMAPALVKALGNFHKASAVVSRDVARRPVAELTGLLREHAESTFAPPGVGPMGQLTDGCVHLRDCARPLGVDDDLALEDWRLVLDFLPTARARRGFLPRGRLDALHLVADDQDWSTGEGATLTGPSEALVLAVLGRRVALSDLSGPGVEVLAARLR